MLISKKIKYETPDLINLATNTTLKAKISEIKNKISSIADLAIITALTSVENKITNVSNIVKKKNK